MKSFSKVTNPIDSLGRKIQGRLIDIGIILEEDYFAISTTSYRNVFTVAVEVEDKEVARKVFLRSTLEQKTIKEVADELVKICQTNYDNH